MSDEKSALGDLPDGVESAMFLRDGWPDAVVCKVMTKSGCVGIGWVRYRSWIPWAPRPTVAEADAAALAQAIINVSSMPPDYTEVHEHMAAMKAAAEARAK